jgi:hypothetical protein
MCLLPGGALYFDSKLSLDLDGSPFWNQDIPDSQPQTSVKWEDGVDVDSNVYSYFVLPGNFWNVNGFREGDIGVVIFGMRVVFACFVDSGPQKSLGEGSINLHRELGFETLRNGKVNRKWGLITALSPLFSRTRAKGSLSRKIGSLTRATIPSAIGSDIPCSKSSKGTPLPTPNCLTFSAVQNRRSHDLHS